MKKVKSPFLTTTENISKIIDKIAALTASALLVSIVVVVFIAVVYRYVFNNAFQWSEEYARFAMIWMGLLGASLALVRNEHIAIEYFISHFSPKIRLLVTIVIRIIMALFLFYIILKGIPMAMRAILQTSPALGISMAIPLFSLPIFGFVSLIQLIFITIKDIYQ
jgi:TRAP-type C4-dicarboxylate transport system permease small subunit